MNMRPSKVLNLLRKGEIACCTKLNLADSRAVEIVGIAGFDCAWTDMEHVPNDLSQVEKQILAAKAYGMDCLVRVPRGSYSSLVWPLEMDATGIMVPHCMSAEEAKKVVRTTRFHPFGLRPVDSGNSDGPFCLRPMEEYMRFSNEQKFAVLQIEDKEAVDCMEDIVAVDGVDVFFIGPADLSHSYGVPGQMTHASVQGAIDKLAALCKKYNRHWGMPCGPEKAPELIAKGAQFLAAGADVIAIIEMFKKMREGYKAAGLTFEAEF